MSRKFLHKTLLFAALLMQMAGNAGAQWIRQGSGPGFNVFAMCVMGTDLYAGGIGIAKWDGTTWTSLGAVTPSVALGSGSLGINVLTVYKGEIYAAGDIGGLGSTTIDPQVGVAKWNGTSWVQVGTNTATNLSGVTQMVEYHGDLYASGNYGVNKWDGTSWTTVGATDGPANVILAVYHDELYAASSFTHISTTSMTTGKGFAKWNGTSWTALPGFFDTLSVLPGINAAKASAMCVFKDELYVTGSLDYAGSTFVRGAARWNGTSWNTTNGGLKGNGTLLSTCISTDANNIYIVGPVQKVNATNDSVYLSTYWDGSKWNPMFGGDALYTSFGASVNYKGDIYTAYNGFAKWKSDKMAVQNIAATGNGLQIYPNPSTGIVNVTLPSGSSAVTVTNTLGAVVWQRQAVTAGASTIDISGVPGGLYFVTVNSAQGRETQKIMIQR